MYAIYKITSPSGRYYVGLTKSAVSERWRQHVKRAATRGDNHPFYCAIRKYGSESFTVEQIDAAPDKPAAQALEREHIAACPTPQRYNVSAGGEADGEAGAKIFWDAMKANPAARLAYLAKLSAAKLAEDWSDYAELSRRAQEWRKANPREAYRMTYRAIRMALKAQARTPAPADTRGLKERLMWKHKRASKTRENALRLWAGRTDAQRADVGQAISTNQRTRWATVTDLSQRASLTASARAAIDRSTQGPAASAGLKRFWDDLRADPARYEQYMAARKATLAKTNSKKKARA